MSVTVKISGKVKTLSRNIMHSLNRLTDCSCSSEMSLVACFQTRASNSSDRTLCNHTIHCRHVETYGTYFMTEPMYISTWSACTRLWALGDITQKFWSIRSVVCDEINWSFIYVIVNCSVWSTVAATYTGYSQAWLHSAAWSETSSWSCWSGVS